MNERIREILVRITALEDELRDALQEQQVHWKYQLDGTRVRFEKSIREAHREFMLGVLPWLRRARLRNAVTAPLVYAMAAPLMLLDLSVTVFQLLCFPLYRAPHVARRHYVVIDRHQLRYLNSIERLNCIYCGYAGGVIAYAREVAARTEQYWCPIKHARQMLDPHRRYANFADYGDAVSYQDTIKRLREELSRERDAKAAAD